MSDNKEYSATPATAIEAHIMSVHSAKSEAEWWAQREIIRLRTELAAEKVLTSACERVNRRNDELLDEIARLREALKPFADKADHHTQGAHWMDAIFTVDECRAARAAMGESDDT